MSDQNTCTDQQHEDIPPDVAITIGFWNQQEPSNNYTSSSDDIRAGFAGNTIVHCLLPRPTRNAIVITTTKYVSKELLSAKVCETLEQDMTDH